MAQIPLYSTRGDWAGMLIDSHLYSNQGEWIGWVDDANQVFSVGGEYVGWLSKDGRVLCKRDTDETLPRRQPPAPPAERVRLPTTVPLPPLMAELRYDIIDVFDDRPERLHTVDFDEKAKDID